MCLLTEEDIYFVKTEEERIRHTLELKLDAENDENGKGGRIKETDRSRFVIFFVTDEVREAFLQSQKCNEHWTETDGKNSEEWFIPWYELLVELFNVPKVEATTECVKYLYSDFNKAIDRPKGLYDLSDDKAEDLMQDMNTRMRDIVGRYNRSGNGSDMRVMDDDSDIEDLDEQTTTPKHNEVS
jgi:hypothetical protein